MTEVVVLGGGLAGAGAASLLASAGQKVRLLEREAGPHHKVCGEFLSVEAQQDLARIGLDLAQLGAVPIDRIRLVSGRREAEAPLPFTALGLSRKLLDEALLELAGARGAKVERGVRVTQVNGNKVSTSHGDCKPGQLLLATGKHDVRGAKRAAPPDESAFVGFKMHFQLDLRTRAELEGLIELVIFEGGYAGLQLVSPEVMNLCLIVRRTRLAEAGGDWTALLASLMDTPGLARRLDDARPLFSKPLAISGLPYGYVCQQSDDIYRLGDQAAMTASLTGDGMAIALRSAIIASECVLSETPPEVYRKRLALTVTPQIRRAMWLQRMAEVPLLMALALPAFRYAPGLLSKAAAMTRLPSQPTGPARGTGSTALAPR
ncbi:MAG: FAD-dependent monooxygenase [Novosphingobium sp.]|nr:FAD-dependent monooxygenase [Novosphingobium sp.]